MEKKYENGPVIEIGLTALLCVVASAWLGQWQHTYVGGVIGAWLSCFATQRLHHLWYVALGTAAVVTAQNATVAHAVAAMLIAASLLDHSQKWAFQTLRH